MAGAIVSSFVGFSSDLGPTSMTEANGIAHLSLGKGQRSDASAALAGAPSLQPAESLTDRLEPSANGVAAQVDGMRHPATEAGPGTEADSPMSAASLRLLFEEQHRCALEVFGFEVLARKAGSIYSRHWRGHAQHAFRESHLHAYGTAHSDGLSTLPCRRRYLDHFFQRLDYQPIERFCQVDLETAFGVAHSALHASATARLHVPVHSRMHLVTPSCLADC